MQNLTPEFVIVTVAGLALLVRYFSIALSEGSSLRGDNETAERIGEFFEKV